MRILNGYWTLCKLIIYQFLLYFLFFLLFNIFYVFKFICNLISLHHLVKITMVLWNYGTKIISNKIFHIFNVMLLPIFIKIYLLPIFCKILSSISIYYCRFSTKFRLRRVFFIFLPILLNVAYGRLLLFFCASKQKLNP